jgi:hypothetical protein
MGRSDAHTKFWYENLKERDYLEYLGLDGKIIFMALREQRWENVNLIHVSQYRDRWQALTNIVTKFRVP